MRLTRNSAFALAIILAMPSFGSAQWLHYPTADVPRTSDGADAATARRQTRSLRPLAHLEEEPV